MRNVCFDNQLRKDPRNNITDQADDTLYTIDVRIYVRNPKNATHYEKNQWSTGPRCDNE